MTPVTHIVQVCSTYGYPIGRIWEIKVLRTWIKQTGATHRKCKTLLDIQWMTALYYLWKNNKYFNEIETNMSDHLFWNQYISFSEDYNQLSIIVWERWGGNYAGEGIRYICLEAYFSFWQITSRISQKNESLPQQNSGEWTPLIRQIWIEITKITKFKVKKVADFRCIYSVHT